jgi:signal transduction histidine kinase
MSARQARNSRKQYFTSLPKWRRPFVGYICAIPILSLALFLAVILQELLQRFLFPATFLLLALLLTALAWGVGPALLLLVIGIIALDFYVIPLVGQYTLREGDVVQVLPVFAIGLIMLLVIGQRERAYRKIQRVGQELERYASELEAMNSQLENEQREQESFLSMASHELKTPITTIRSYAQLLRRRLTKRSTSADLLDFEPAFKRIDDQTIRLTTLIDQLLDVKTFHSYGIALSKSQYDLNQLCQKVIEDQRELTGRDVVFSPHKEPLAFQMDVGRMTQVVINIVSNALKYSSQDRPVEVRVSRNDQCAMLQVQDHGCGITSDEIPHIFERFYRTPEARSSKTGGMGLGLAICKEIVDQHEGRIWCESELGIGSTFFVELPLCTEAPRTVGVSSARTVPCACPPVEDTYELDR